MGKRGQGRRLAALLLAVCLLAVGPAMTAAAASVNVLVYYVGERSYLGLNRLNGALAYAVNMSGDVVIPSEIEGVAVTSISNATFQNSAEMTSITVPDSVEKIGDDAFKSCTSLETVRLPEGLTALGKNCFQYCYALKEINVPAALTVLNDNTFASCLSLEGVNIPAQVTAVGDYCFYDCKSLQQVRFNGTVNSIGDYAFAKCAALEEIALPEGLGRLPIALFDECASLRSVELPGTVDSIGKSAFGNCTGLERLVLPEGVRRVEDWAFIGCKNLEVLSMPDSIRGIAGDSFYGCDNVTFYVNAGSYSQVFASANGIPFVLGTLDKPQPTVSPEPSAYPVTSFTDDKGHWAEEDIKWAVGKGYLNGVSSTQFAPNMNLTRGMLVTVLYRVEGSPQASAASFTDLTQDWYKPAVGWAEENQVVNGVGGGRFAPESNITREQLATILYRYAQRKGYAPTPRGDMSAYVDSWRVSDYAADAVSWAVGVGIINGRGDGYLSPEGNATRAEAVVMLHRFLSLPAPTPEPEPSASPAPSPAPEL